MSLVYKPQKWLWPLGKCYQAINTARNRLYDRNIIKSYQSEIAVICVGNVVVGGSCKSPFCDYLAEKLAINGRRPVILSRGYGGSIEGPALVRPSDIVSSVGDEAIMHFQLIADKGKVVVGADRVKAIEYIEANSLGDVVIMDDGLQHRRVRPQVAILMLDVSYPDRVEALTNGRVLPAGYLREKKEEALKKADIVVFVKKGGRWKNGELENFKAALQIDIDCYAASLSPSYYRDLYDGRRIELQHLVPNDVVVVSALADPESFKMNLKQLGLNLHQEFYYSDHHHYSQKDWDKFESQELPIITTTKDGVKLKPFIQKAREVLELVSIIQFISKNTEQAFWDKMHQRLTNRF